MKIYGIVPAAGKGTRLSPLPFSKELYPIGYRLVNEQYRPRPVSLHLIESYKTAGIQDVFWIIASNKLDIQQFYKSGSAFHMNFSYLVQENQRGLVDAICQADPWLPSDDYLICLGMPDTLFHPITIFDQMKKHILKTNADIVLALFETTQWHKLGMVEFEKDSKSESLSVTHILDKPKTKPDTNFAWGGSIWRSSFQNHLKTFLQNYTSPEEYSLSDAFNEAIKRGLRIEAILGDSYVDIGTVEDLQKAIELTNTWQEEDKNEH